MLSVLILFTVILTRPQNAKALVPTDPKTIVALVGNTSFQETLNVTLKEYGADVLVWAIKQASRLLRNEVIRWISEGQFGSPQFVGSYFIDPAKWGETAARLFMTQLTGINFCNYNQNVPTTLSYNLKLRFELQCSLSDPFNFQIMLNNMNIAAELVTLTDRILILEPENNPNSVLLSAQIRKLEAEERAKKSRSNEALAGNSWFGKKDPKTGKTITPGQTVASFLGETIGSNYRECDNADEWGEAILNCGLQVLADILDASVGKIINEGLSRLGEALPSTLPISGTFGTGPVTNPPANLSPITHIISTPPTNICGAFTCPSTLPLGCVCTRDPSGCDALTCTEVTPPDF